MKRIQVIILRQILSIFLIAFVNVLFCQLSLADQKIPVEVVATSEDIVGKKLVYKIKEEVRRSSSLKITTNIKEPRVKIYIVTLDPYKRATVPGYSGNSTVYSLVIAASGVYFSDIIINHYVGVCPINYIKEVAENTVVDIDENILLFNNAKSNWESFSEYLTGVFATKDQKFQNETQKLMNDIGELTLKASDLEEKLNKEKVKKWWIKLWESFK